MKVEYFLDIYFPGTMKTTFENFSSVKDVIQRVEILLNTPDTGSIMLSRVQHTEV